MALRNTKLFGLEVNNLFADVRDKDLALTTLNLPPKDLDIIRESSVTVSQTDFVTLSKLDSPLYKTLDRLYRDSNQSYSVIENKAGFDTLLIGNLTVNGKISANSIRFKFVEGSGPSATIKFADISTSRVSSWNSTDSPVLDTSPIFYGSKVGILTGGQIQLAGSVLGNRLKTSLTAELKEFDAEVPTSKIECNIGGQTVNLFAMKGIPLVFKGFFRNLNATITRSSIPNIRPTWRIEDVSDSSKRTDFVNRAQNNINYRGSAGKERFIKYYYNPNNILSITIVNAGINEIPDSVLPNLTSLVLRSNQLKEFPNLTKLTPNLSVLSLEDNPLYLSENPNERKFTQSIVDKIPNSITSLTMGRCYSGSIPQNLFDGNNLPNLETLNLIANSNRIQTIIHSFDDDQNPAQLPNVGENVTFYGVTNNNFSAIGITTAGNNQYNIQDLPNLVTLRLRNNRNLTNSTFTIASNDIQEIDIGGTNLPFPDLRNKVNLELFVAISHRNFNNSVDTSILVGGEFKCKGCIKLRTYNVRSSRARGRIPTLEFPELLSFDVRYTRVQGQLGSTCISAGTFQFLPKIRSILIDSRFWEVTTPIDSNALAFNTELIFFWFRTYGKTTGKLPSFSSCSKLRFILAPQNAFTGPIPNFASNPIIYYVSLANNQLSGEIPSIENKTNLRYLYLHNNSFTALNKFINLSSLEIFYAYNNNLTGQIPDYSECPKLKRLYLYNNQLNSYFSGSLSTATSIRNLLLQNNNLSSNEINNIIQDLFTNYENFNRSGVVVNLLNNAPPSGDETIDKLNFLKTTAGWSISTD